MSIKDGYKKIVREILNFIIVLGFTAYWMFVYYRIEEEYGEFFDISYMITLYCLSFIGFNLFDSNRVARYVVLLMINVFHTMTWLVPPLYYFLKNIFG